MPTVQSGKDGIAVTRRVLMFPPDRKLLWLSVEKFTRTSKAKRVNCGVFEETEICFESRSVEKRRLAVPRYLYAVLEMHPTWQAGCAA
jgi:hypothetical protein